MSENTLLAACKSGIGIQQDTDAFDDVINQKITTVKAFFRRAGVSDETLASEDAEGVIVLGVNDIWNQEPGEVRFSKAFMSMAKQLILGG